MDISLLSNAMYVKYHDWMTFLKDFSKILKVPGDMAEWNGNAH